MIRAGAYIMLGLTVATPVAALSIAPMCSGEVAFDGLLVDEAERQEGGFVNYRLFKRGTKLGDMVLENCANGDAIVAPGDFSLPEGDPQHADNVADAVRDYMFDKKAYTMRDVVSGLKARGIPATRRTLKNESCACKEFFPELRGNRKPHE